MADTELKGTIQLTLDNSEVDKGLDAIESKQDAKGKPKEAGKDFAATFASELKKNITNALSGAFNSMGSAGKAFGTSLKSFLSSPAAGAAPGTSGAASLAGGAAEGGEAGAAGAGEGAVAAGAAGGPVGIAIGIAVGALIVMGAAVKKVVDSLLAFGRSLADVSASMGMAFGQFDMQILQLKNQIGEAIAPEMNELLTQLANLARDVVPILIFALKILIAIIAGVAKKLHDVFSFVSGAASIATNPLKSAFSAITGGNGIHISDQFKAAMNEAFPGAGEMIKMLTDWLGNQNDKETTNTGGQMIASFQDILKRRDAQAAKDQAAIHGVMNGGGAHAPPLMPVRFNAGGGIM